MKQAYKFIDVDIIAALEAIMKQNTIHYQSDFELDKKLIKQAVLSPSYEDRQLLWLSRPAGTYCFRERDVFLKETSQNITWRFYGEQTRDNVLAYAVELKSAKCGKVKGDLYMLDYQKHFKEVAEKSVPADNRILIYERGERMISAGQYFDGDPDPQFGKFEYFEAQPNDPAVLKSLLLEQRQSRRLLKTGDLKVHLKELSENRKHDIPSV